MKIQSISIVVPTKGCVNNCPFCCSKMHDCPYENRWNNEQMRKRIQYAVMNGVNTCILTGTGEAMQNVHFLENLSSLFFEMDNPFPNVEIQTTGVFLSEIEEPDGYEYSDGYVPEPIYPYIKLLKKLGVNTVSLSVSNVFSDEINMSIIGVKPKLQFKLGELISLLKEKDFNIRLSLNMFKHYDDFTPQDILSKCKELRADQVTFRKMYRGHEDTAENLYVSINKCSEKTLNDIENYIEGGKTYYPSTGNFQEYAQGEGEFLYRLPFGGKVYSVMGMSVVIDNDCMSKETNDTLKYIILRENGKLYCRWDDEGSLIF